MTNRLRWLLVALLGLSLAPRPAHADCTLGAARVTDVRLLNTDKRTPNQYVQLDDVLALKVDGLADLRACLDKGKPLTLFLRGLPLSAIPELPRLDPATGEVAFTLTVEPDDRKVWNALLGEPSPGQTYRTNVSIGLAGGYAVASDAFIALRPLPPFEFGFWAIAFLAILVGFMVFVAKSNILRGGTPSGGRTFSLARSQGAWWFFIVLASYLLIGLATGDYANSLNATALTLLGISAATFLGSAAVDASKKDQATTEQAARIADLNAAIAKLNPNEPAEKAQIATAQRSIGKLEGQSQGWLIDVLSDAGGIDFHRFQIVAWSLVLGVVFAWEVWQRLAMPDFNATLLGLQGLSAATYVGLKIPEKMA